MKLDQARTIALAEYGNLKMETFGSKLLLLLVLAIIVIVVLARLYRKATREVSLIRTGVGGQKVIMAGGALALPYFHEVSEVNMRTLRLEINRTGEQSLITKDRLRVDIGASFSVAVEGSEEGVARAAQTLGDRTFQAEKIREIVGGKLVDALSAVAAQMTMDELHEGRAGYVREVRNLVAEDLAEIGLRLQSVSLTALDQTPFKDLDENNAFNAVGMRRLAEVISTARKERAQIDADAEVSVRLSTMEATRRKLQIEQDEEQARIEQVQQLETMRAAQAAEVASRKADAERAAEEARIEKELRVRESEIARDRATRATEIARDLDLQRAEINKEQQLQIAEQERQISVSQKSEEESKARAAADHARADATKAAEFIVTTRLIAEAEREKQVALLESQKKSSAEADRLRTLASAQRDAATDHAAAQLEAARADAEAHKTRADAKKVDLMSEAEGQRALNEARNTLSNDMVAMQVDLARLETLPKALAEMVRPAEKIDSIKIHQVTGLGNGAGGSGEVGSTSDGKPPVNQALDSIMGMAVQLPALKKLGEELGLSMDDSLQQVTDAATRRPNPDQKKGD